MFQKIALGLLLFGVSLNVLTVSMKITGSLRTIGQSAFLIGLVLSILSALINFFFKRKQ